MFFENSENEESFDYYDAGLRRGDGIGIEGVV